MNQDINTNTDSASKPNSEEPLVSIIVITYNSAKYVIETLESARAQTCKNIELIVSDDCSTDDTINICTEWLNGNKKRFVRTELITVERNTGISANCNRGIKASVGVWIKLIAGDDILLRNCISDNIQFIQQNPGVDLLFSEIETFGDRADNHQELKDHKTPDFFYKTAKQQFNQLVVKNRVFAPSSFIKLALIKEIGGFDERIKNLEDRPFWIKATKAGYKLFYMPIPTVGYRVHSGSIYNSHSDKLHNEKINLFYLYQLPNISFKNFLNIWHIYLSLHTFKNKNYKILKLLSPIWYSQKVSMLYKIEKQ